MPCRLGLAGSQVRSLFSTRVPLLTVLRVKQDLKSGEMMVTGDQWPIFLYRDYTYDAEDPWGGLFRSSILISVGPIKPSRGSTSAHPLVPQAFQYIFTSPSSVDKEPKATRSGNARIHGMTQVTPASIAYIATQVCAKNSSADPYESCWPHCCLDRSGSH